MSCFGIKASRKLLFTRIMLSLFVPVQVRVQSGPFGSGSRGSDYQRAQHEPGGTRCVCVCVFLYVLAGPHNYTGPFEG